MNESTTDSSLRPIIVRSVVSWRGKFFGKLIIGNYIRFRQRTYLNSLLTSDQSNYDIFSAFGCIQIRDQYSLPPPFHSVIVAFANLSANYPKRYRYTEGFKILSLLIINYQSFPGLSPTSYPLRWPNLDLIGKIFQKLAASLGWAFPSFSDG